MNDEEAAFEAGQSGRFKTYAEWRQWYYTCQKCGRDTSEYRVHECLADHPYRPTQTNSAP